MIYDLKSNTVTIEYDYPVICLLHDRLWAYKFYRLRSLSRNLKSVLDHEHIAASDWDMVRVCACVCVLAYKYMSEIARKTGRALRCCCLALIFPFICQIINENRSPKYWIFIQQIMTMLLLPYMLCRWGWCLNK